VQDNRRSTQTTDDLGGWREWARKELFEQDRDPCAAMILVLIDEVRRLRNEAADV
jgi:hypothetical protein